MTKSLDLKRALYFTCLALSVVMFGVFLINSFLATDGDFQVYWRAGRNYVQGIPLYDIARDGTHCYKYPPWLAPFFLPFSALPLRWAEAAWRLCLVFSLGYCVRWCANHSRTPWLAMAAVIPFWGTWMNNLIAGQITTVLLAAALWGSSTVADSNQRDWLGWTALLTSLSAKLFHLIALAGIPQKAWRIRPLAATCLLFVALTIPAVLASGGLTPLFHSYLQMLSTPGDILGGGFYGFPALAVKWLGWAEHDPQALSRAALILIAVFAPVYVYIARNLESTAERFALALGLATALHPLAFSYTFGTAYPLAALALDRAASGKRLSRLISVPIVLVGIFAITLVTSKVLGSLAGYLNGFTIKSIGILIVSVPFAVPSNSRRL